MLLYFEYQHLLLIFIGQWNDGDEEEEWIRRQALRVAGIDGPLRSGFDAGISWITVVQLDGGKPGAAGEDDRAISGWALKQGTSVYETRDFDVSNQEVREVKDRTSGCERRDFSRSCRVFAGLKRGKEMSLYIY